MIPNSARIRFALPILCAICLGAVPAFAQRLPSTIKLAANIAPADQAAIDAFVQNQVKSLVGDNAAAQKAARQVLIEQVLGSPSPAFAAAYANSIDAAILPLAGNPSLRVRLNAAIANGEIAKLAKSAGQARATLAFMSDKSDPVALWGLKAARSVIPPFVLLQPRERTTKLLSGVVDTVKAHNDSGPIIEEAYQALTLDDFKNVLDPVDASVSAVLPDVYHLLEYRISLYAAGVPTSPLADNYATLFLTRSKTWKPQTPAQQLQTMRVCYQLIEGLGALLGNPNIQNRDDLVLLVRQSGRALQVVGNAMPDAELQNAAVKIADITAQTDANEVAKRIADLKNTGAMQKALAGPSSAGRGGVSPFIPEVETAAHVDR